MYDYYIGGKSNYIVDRKAAHDVLTAFPAIEVAARASRAYAHRAGRFLAHRGIRQFVEVGIGMPAAPNFHEAVQAVAPDATVVYVDNNPLVLVYADMFEGDGPPEGITRCVEADVTRPGELLAAVEEAGIDFGQPVALGLHALLEFLPDDMHPYAVVSRLLGPLAANSYLSLSHCTPDLAPDRWKTVTQAYAQHGIPVQARSRAEVLPFFRGLAFADPGLAVAHRWRPEPGSGPILVTDRQVSVYAGVARKTGTG